MNIFINCAFDISSRIGKLFSLSFPLSLYASLNISVFFLNKSFNKPFNYWESAIKKANEQKANICLLMKYEIYKKKTISDLLLNEIAYSFQCSNRVHKAFICSFNAFESKFSSFIVSLLHIVINHNH